MKNTNKAQAINEMNTYINALVPKLIEYVENNEIKTKTFGFVFWEKCHHNQQRQKWELRFQRQIDF